MFREKEENKWNRREKKNRANKRRSTALQIEQTKAAVDKTTMNARKAPELERHNPCTAFHQ